MAIDDTVNGISAENAVLTLQPAAGVEIVITSYGGDGIASQLQLTDGSLDAGFVSDGALERDTNQTNCKVFINNTNYITVAALGAGSSSSYSGIVTK